MLQCGCVFSLVSVVVIVVVSTLHDMTVTACSGTVEDNSVRTCVEDMTSLDAETKADVETLRYYYDDYPTHCRYGRSLLLAYITILILIAFRLFCRPILYIQ